MFNANSALVKLWVNNVKNSLYAREQVPKLSNLQTIVHAELDKENAE